jgi:prepilin-type N-terminal cleavage/methylation domain-containing protein
MRNGFTLVELLVGVTFLSVGLLAIAAMFPMGYVVVNESGKMTMTLTGARQILEDVRTVPFVDLTDLNGFDTTDSATLPADEPQRTVVRRWRYALAGEGNGFTYTSTEKSRWASLSLPHRERRLERGEGSP